jgi:hypothetical protein
VQAAALLAVALIAFMFKAIEICAATYVTGLAGYGA